MANCSTTSSRSESTPMRCSIVAHNCQFIPKNRTLELRVLHISISLASIIIPIWRNKVSRLNRFSCSQRCMDSEYSLCISAQFMNMTSISVFSKPRRIMLRCRNFSHESCLFAVCSLFSVFLHRHGLAVPRERGNAAQTVSVLHPSCYLV
jgi:hypothetical protein